MDGIPPVDDQAPPEDQTGVAVQDLPESMGLPPQTMVVRGMYYGKNFGEHNRDANFGPDGQELQDEDVALSPNVSQQLGLQRGDKIWVGNRLHTYNDESYHSPGVPTQNAVEVRNYPLDGKVQIRKAMPEEVDRYQKMPSAMAASYMTGLDPSQITAQSVNAIIQPEIQQQRALIAGEPTAAAVENWNLESLNQQNEVAQAGNLSDSSGEVTPESMGMETSAESLGGVTSGIGEGMPTPSTRGMPYVRAPNGDIIYNGGEVIAHPSTQSVEYQIGNQTFVRTRDGRTMHYPTVAVYRDPTTGKTYNKNAPGMPEIHLAGQMPDLQAGVTGDAALADLSPAQQNMVKMIANYQVVLPPSAMRSPAFLPYLARVAAYSPDYSMMKAAGRQQMIKSMASMAPNTAGYILSSANTMLEHLQNLKEAADALPEHDIQKFNSVENYLSKNAGSRAVTDFQFARNALLNELTRTLKGGVSDNADMLRWDQSLMAANSKEQMDGLINKQFPVILKGRLDGFRFLYQNVMDKPYDKPIVNEQNMAFLKRIGFDQSIDAGDPTADVRAKQIQNVQSGLPPKGTFDVQGAKLYLAKHPDDAELRQRLIDMGELPAPTATPAP